MAYHLSKLQRHLCIFLTSQCQKRIFHSKSKLLAGLQVGLKNTNLDLYGNDNTYLESRALFLSRKIIKVNASKVLNPDLDINSEDQRFPVALSTDSNLPTLYIFHSVELYPIDNSLKSTHSYCKESISKKRRLSTNGVMKQKPATDLPTSQCNEHLSNVGFIYEYFPPTDVSSDSRMTVNTKSKGHDLNNFNCVKYNNNNKMITHCRNNSGEKAPCDNSDILSFSSTRRRNAESGDKGPTAEQLHNATEKVTDLVKDLLSGSTSSDILHPNVIFENNLYGKNKVSQGLTAYKLEILKLCMTINVNITKASLDIINIVTTEKTGVIRIYWRMSGHSLIKTMQVKLFTKEFEDEEIQWIEAFSYFHIGSDGLVHKIRIDPMLPDDNEEKVTLKDKLKEMLNPAKTNPAVSCIPT